MASSRTSSRARCVDEHVDPIVDRPTGTGAPEGFRLPSRRGRRGRKARAQSVRHPRVGRSRRAASTRSRGSLARAPARRSATAARSAAASCATGATTTTTSRARRRPRPATRPGRVVGGRERGLTLLAGKLGRRGRRVPRPRLRSDASTSTAFGPGRDHAARNSRTTASTSSSTPNGAVGSSCRSCAAATAPRGTSPPDPISAVPAGRRNRRAGSRSRPRSAFAITVRSTSCSARTSPSAPGSAS